MTCTHPWGLAWLLARNWNDYITKLVGSLRWGEGGSRGAGVHSQPGG